MIATATAVKRMIVTKFLRRWIAMCADEAEKARRDGDPEARWKYRQEVGHQMMNWLYGHPL